jgi:hypothetical protein
MGIPLVGGPQQYTAAADHPAASAACGQVMTVAEDVAVDYLHGTNR